MERTVRDKRWIKTRQRLIRAGFELVGEQGIIGVNVDDIASRAAIAKQTFYNHFDDREAFFIELRRESRDIFSKIVAKTNISIDNSLVRITRGVAIYGRMAIIDPCHARFFALSASGDLDAELALSTGLAADLREGLNSGLLVFSTIRGALTYIGGLTQVLVMQLLRIENADQAVAVTQEILTMMLRGLGVPLDEAERRAAQAADAIFYLPQTEFQN